MSECLYYLGTGRAGGNLDDPNACGFCDGPKGMQNAGLSGEPLSSVHRGRRRGMSPQ